MESARRIADKEIDLESPFSMQQLLPVLNDVNVLGGCGSCTNH
jgi:hypothetical protein